MKYIKLAHEFLESMQDFRKASMHKNINDILQGESFVLQFIYRQGEGILPGEIGSEMQVSSARIAAALNSLEKKRLITRSIDANDRRKILVSLTPEGKTLAEQHGRAVMRDTANMLRLLGEKDAKEYIRINKRLAEIAAKRLQQTT